MSHTSAFNYTSDKKMLTPGQTRFIRCWLVVDNVFTKIMRQYLLNSQISSRDVHYNIMHRANQEFRDKLFPEEIKKVQTIRRDGYEQCDISLMYKIVRFKRFRMIIPDLPTRGWNNNPGWRDNTIGDNIQRIRQSRNDFVHRGVSEVSEAEFKEYFTTFVDVARRADKHLKKKRNEFVQLTESYRECLLDQNVEDKYLKEIETFKEIIKMSPGPKVSMTFYMSKDIENKIEEIRSGKKKYVTVRTPVKLRLRGIKKAKQKAEQINSCKDELRTNYIFLDRATDGSLGLYVKIQNTILLENDVLYQEIEAFLKKVFNKADLKCKPGQHCITSMETVTDDEESSASEDEDITLEVTAKNEVCMTIDPISRNTTEFIKTVQTKVEENDSRDITVLIKLAENGKRKRKQDNGEEVPLKINPNGFD